MSAGLATLMAVGLAGTGRTEDAATPRTTELRGKTVDVSGEPVADVNVFVADSATGTVTAKTKSGDDGHFTLVVPARRHSVGIMSPTLYIEHLEKVSATEIKIVVAWPGGNLHRPLGAGQFPYLRDNTAQPLAQTDKPGHELTMPQTEVGIDLLRGRTVDEERTVLSGIRVSALDRQTGLEVGVTYTNKDGGFVLPLPPGPYLIKPSAPGLKMASATRAADQRLVFVMSIDAEPQQLTIRERRGDGRTITFDINDSIDPAYVPPPQVKAYFRWAWGSDLFTSWCLPDADGNPMLHRPGASFTGGEFSLCKLDPVDPNLPISVWARRYKVPKFWWLAVLRMTPSNPARIAHW